MKSVYSQNGEHEIIEDLLSKATSTSGNTVLVEFGASRGRDNSNLFAFGESGKTLVLIEADPDRYKDLDAAIRAYPNIVGIHAKVTFSPGKKGGKVQEGTLDEILTAQGIDPNSVVAVSIDIDSDDAAVFEKLGFVPEIAVCEFNPTFPSDAAFRNPPGQNIGNSPLEVQRVAIKLGMYLVAATETNLIFMKNTYMSQVPKVDLLQSIEALKLTRFALGYDGTLVRFSTEGENSTSGIYHNGWNDSFVRQPLPPRLREFSNARRWIRILYFVATGVIQPVETTRAIFQYLQNRKRIGSKRRRVRS